MSVEEELASVSPTKDMLMTIGAFDGVHIGHKYLIAQLKEHARRRNLFSGVVTFRKHPRKVLSLQSELTLLTGVSQKMELLKKEGVDYVVPLSFTPELARLSAREFVALLQKYLNMTLQWAGTKKEISKRSTSWERRWDSVWSKHIAGGWMVKS